MISEQPQETNYYQDQMVFFSSKRFIISGQTFMPNSIISVNTKQVPGSRGLAWVILAVGMICLFLGISLANSPALIKGNPTNIIFIIAGVVLCLAGGFKFINTAPHFALVLGTTGGYIEPIKSPDFNYINHLQNIINQILYNRG